MGLYALTAHAVGLCDDIGSCVERLLPNRQVFDPSPERHAIYENLFSIYLDISRKSLETFDRLAAICQKHGLSSSTQNI